MRGYGFFSNHGSSLKTPALEKKNRHDIAACLRRICGNAGPERP
jgi:hypothetical protein